MSLYFLQIFIGFPQQSNMLISIIYFYGHAALRTKECVSMRDSGNRQEVFFYEIEKILWTNKPAHDGSDQICLPLAINPHYLAVLSHCYIGCLDNYAHHQQNDRAHDSGSCLNGFISQFFCSFVTGGKLDGSDSKLQYLV